ncbi:MAG TPA: hypothetical protein VMW56_02540, partial [Candidatus Margulisiibacteriota bacterium]|nr:hypothetical protein [Candidatus Margulisiibacteriota bacterium]
AAADRAVLVQVKDVPALVKAQGGSTGAIAMSIVPETITAKVYSELASKLASGLKDQNVDADVKVVTAAGYQPAGSSPIWKPIALGGIGTLAFLMVRHFIKRGK